MPNFTGKLKGVATSESLLCMNDIPGHVFLQRSSSAQQSCSDNLFNGTKNTSWGTAELTHGNGHEHGFFMNEHSNGDRECGSYECKITTVNGRMSMDGQWKYTSGTGQFKNISGHGTFKGHMLSPVESELSFEGSYELKAGTKAA